MIGISSGSHQGSVTPVNHKEHTNNDEKKIEKPEKKKSIGTFYLGLELLCAKLVPIPLCQYCTHPNISMHILHTVLCTFL